MKKAAKSDGGIHDAIASLNIEEMLSVDAAATEIEVKHELGLLRSQGAGGNIYDSAGNIAGSGGGFDEFAPSTYGDSVPPLPPASNGSGNGSAADAAKIKSLEKELEKCKKQLIDAKSNDASSASGDSDAKEAQQAIREQLAAQHKSEMDSLESEMKTMKLNNSKLSKNVSKAEDEFNQKAKECEQYSAEIEKIKKAAAADIESSADGAAQAAGKMVEMLESDITRLKVEVKKLETELKSSKAESTEDMEKACKELSDMADIRVQTNSEEVTAACTIQKDMELKALEKKLKAAEEEKLAAQSEEIEARMEAEKEEMIDAMAQEVEELETSKDEEIEGLNASLAAADADKTRAEEQLRKVSQSSTMIVSELKRVASTARSLKQEQVDVAAMSKQQLNEMKQSIKSQFGNQIVTKMKVLNKEVASIAERYNKEVIERKKLHNMIQELKGNIRVYMRCRPPSKKEIAEMGGDETALCCVSFPNINEVKVFNEKNREKVWEFDETFDFNSTQSRVYKDVSGLVTSVMDGYNVCIFAYGQTGSGKTHTMAGPPSDRGVNTRAMEELFQKASDRGDLFNDTITLSILEVYNEEIKDLLIEDMRHAEKLEVRQGEFGNYVPGLTQCPVGSIQDVFDLFTQAESNRSTATTNMNEHSSRSHMMLTISVISENKSTGQVNRGKLNLVDLAGSERINKSGATGQALKEAQNINKSLSALGDVIAARAAKQTHIPFRNSTLTYLLQDSLSKDSKTLMICCISPSIDSAEETYCSLNFAARVKTVELGKATANKAVAGGARRANTAGGR